MVSVSDVFSWVKKLAVGRSERINTKFARRAEGVLAYSTKPSGVLPITTERLEKDFGRTTESAIGVLTVRVNALVDDVTNLKNALAGFINETHAHVLKVETTIDTLGNIVWTVPRDYGTETDALWFRVSASMLPASEKTEVRLDTKVYVRPIQGLLSADKNPGTPETFLSTTKQWIEFDLSGQALVFGDKVIIELLTDGRVADGEVLIHDLELVYHSRLTNY